MIRKTLKIGFCLFLFAMSACATVPSGPSVMAVPPQGKPFELFMQEDASCRRWAERQIGLSPQEAIDKDTTTGAVVGTAIGAGLGALLGSASGHAGAGALIGGASGLLFGAASGADSGRVYGREAQRRYDIAYMQCMYSYDNQLPENSRGPRRYYRTNTFTPPPQVTRPPTTEPILRPPSELIPPPPPGATPQTPPELMDSKGGMK